MNQVNSAQKKRKKKGKTKAQRHNNLPVASRLLRQQSIVLCVHSGRRRRNNLTQSEESLSLDIKNKKNPTPQKTFSLLEIAEKLQDLSQETSAERLNKHLCGGEGCNRSRLNASIWSRLSAEARSGPLLCDTSDKPPKRFLHAFLIAF